jgi:23S rRNA pseudouridine1911/1915/1917 synthase
MASPPEGPKPPRSDGDRSTVPEIVVDAAADGERLDRFMRRRLPLISRATLAESIARGAVRVNGRGASKGRLLREGDRIVTNMTDGMPRAAADPSLPLRVLYEDPWLVVVDKAAGVPSHALRPGERATVASALLARYPEMAEVGHRALEPGLLHRLDTDTSGILIAARDTETFARLRAAHESGEIDKQYLALCAGKLDAQTLHGYVQADRRVVRVHEEALPGARAVTTEILSAEARGDHSLVRVRARFAARHQIRAQLAALGHPIAGDALYGGRALPGLTHHFLHASDATLKHPVNGASLQLSAPLPSDLIALLSTLSR